MSKVVTLQDYLAMKRESEALAKVKAEARREKKERVKKSLSFLGGVILYWIASFFITMGFFAVALMSL